MFASKGCACAAPDFPIELQLQCGDGSATQSKMDVLQSHGVAADLTSQSFCIVNFTPLAILLQRCFLHLQPVRHTDKGSSAQLQPMSRLRIVSSRVASICVRYSFVGYDCLALFCCYLHPGSDALNLQLISLPQLGLDTPRGRTQSGYSLGSQRGLNIVMGTLVWSSVGMGELVWVRVGEKMRIWLQTWQTISTCIARLV